jgi:hypothetical protein
MAIKGDEGLSCGFPNLLSMAWGVPNGGVAASTPHSAPEFRAAQTDRQLRDLTRTQARW